MSYTIVAVSCVDGADGSGETALPNNVVEQNFCQAPVLCRLAHLTEDLFRHKIVFANLVHHINPNDLLVVGVEVSFH